MLIGLTGRAQAGKDTVCERIAACTDAEVVRHAFADKVYACAAACLGVEVEWLQANKTAPNVRLVTQYSGMPSDGPSFTVREFLQRLGTEGHRDLFGDDFWVKQIDPPVADGRVHVITDVRFPNEAERVHELGGIVCRVIGPAEVEEVADAHASEAGMAADLIDFFMDNSVRSDGFRSLDSFLPALLACASMADMNAAARGSR